MQQAGSIRADSQDAEDAFEFGVAEKADFQGTFALGISKVNLGAQPFAQLILETGYVRIAGGSYGHGLGYRGRLTLLEVLHQRLSLADIHPVAEDTLGNHLLMFLSGQTHNGLGVAHGEAAVANVTLDSWGQLEEAKRIGNGGAALADLGGYLLLGQLELLNQLGITLSFLDRVEILTLQVFDEGQFENGAVIGLPNENRHFGEPEQLSGAPAAFTGDQLQPAVVLTNDERLNDALFFDGIRQFAECLGGKILAGLERARPNPIQRNALDAVLSSRRSGRGGMRKRGGYSRQAGGFADGAAAQQRSQAATQSWLCHGFRVSNRVTDVKFSPGGPGRKNGGAWRVMGTDLILTR